MKKKKVEYIEPTEKCLFHCPHYNQYCCLVGEEDALKCQRPIPYVVGCPNCRQRIEGMRQYYDELYLKFTCESCGQWFSITWEDEDFSKKR